MTEKMMLPAGYQISRSAVQYGVGRRIETTRDGDLQIFLIGGRRPVFEMFKRYPTAGEAAQGHNNLAWRIHEYYMS